ncbi:MAG: hypothetical protein V1798_02425 [Pseudomonadota bacterium]
MLSPSLLFAQSDFKGLEGRQDQLLKQIEGRNAQIQDVSAHLDRLTSSISRIKAKQKSGSSLLQGYRLESQLKEAQQVSNRLDRLTLERADLAAELAATRHSMAGALDRAMEEWEKIAAKPSTNREARREALTEMERLSYLRMQLAIEPLIPSLPATVGDLKAGRGNSDDLSERLNALKDFERRLVRELAAVSADLKQARRQRFVRSELGHLLEEEAFFGEQGFVHNGPPRASKTDLVNQGRTAIDAGTKNPSTPKDAANTAAGSTQPVSATVGESSGATTAASATGPVGAAPPASPGGSVTTGATTAAGPIDKSAGSPANAPASGQNAGSAPVDKSASSIIPSKDSSAPAVADQVAGATAETSQNAATRLNALPLSSATAPSGESEPDALRQLAKAFGVPIRQTREPSAEVLSSGDTQIARLEERMRMTQDILRRLHELTQKFERVQLK